MVGIGGARANAEGQQAGKSVDEKGCVRLSTNLFMDGQQLFSFAMRQVPKLVQETLASNSLTADQVRWFVFHQANAFMNESLGARLHIDAARMPMFLKLVGNTVSSTIPLTISNCHHQFTSGENVMLVGFGVGYSWGACMLNWEPILAA
jgi:3-oxoacyl-[acyl-carrier-protein] synthase-3